VRVSFTFATPSSSAWEESDGRDAEAIAVAKIASGRSITRLPSRSAVTEPSSKRVAKNVSTKTLICTTARPRIPGTMSEPTARSSALRRSR
jgi:hypothetical protein